ncbi:hypothetical protein JCM1840_006046 [Sporobolomyces johnsonii]
MIDCGSQGNLIDEEYARALRLTFVPRTRPIPIEGFDGRPAEQDLAYFDAAVHLQIGSHIELIELNITRHCLPSPPSADALVTHPILAAATTVPSPSPSHPAPVPLTPEPLSSPTPTPAAATLNVAFVSVPAAKRAARQGAHVFTISAHDIVPRKYHDWLDVFSKNSADSLPDHRPYDLKIDIEDGKEIPSSRIYPLSAAELEVLADYIDTHLRSGSSDHLPHPNLNSVTRKNRYPLPLIDETLDRLSGAQYFTKLDVRNGYHQLRIAKGDEWKTAFRTQYGHFEYQVMPFGLTNAPAAFQNLINDTFRPFLDSFVVVYLDDILVYSKTAAEHEQHVRQVLDTIRKAKLYAKAEKCTFDEQGTEYLVFIVDRQGVRMDPKKIDSVRSWPLPSNLREVQSFLGFANFYRRFIKDYSKIAHPLTRLTKKDTAFDLDSAAIAAFTTLKGMFNGEQILCHFRPGMPIELETDASDFALGSVLSQRHEDGKLYPIAFRSRKFDHAEINYEVHDKELLAIIDACKHFRTYLEYVSTATKIFSDHANLRYFFTSRVLNRRQARWYETISE